MSKICYVAKRFNRSSTVIIDRANEIIDEYTAQGFDLTLRQLYYQLVSRNFIANKDSEYKRLGSIISDARLAGLIDWQAIIDRTRNLRSNGHWKDPSAHHSFSRPDLRTGQVVRPALPARGLDREGRAGGNPRGRL